MKTAVHTKKPLIFNWKINSAKIYWDGFLHLLFPSSCLCCEGELLQAEKICCSVCFSELPFTQFEKSTEPTALEQLFWGRISITATYSLLYYEKTNTVKPILQALKYKNRPDIGQVFGALIGQKLNNMPHFSSVEALIPVPIHRKKKYQRGYNQSELLAKGVTTICKIPVHTSLVHKNLHTKSQTTLGRFKRWDNVEDLFTVHPDITGYKHIALVDDVITTGATLESIIRSIRAVAPDIQISVISLAVAK